MTPRRFLGGIAAALALLLAGCGREEQARPDLVFVSSRDGDYSLYEMNADGSAQSRLTDHDPDTSSPARLFFQIEPAWSPDGTEIAFSSRREGTFDIFVMQSDGSGTRRLTSTKEHDSHPTWSPDGERIAFERDGDIHVMRADGSGEQRLSVPTAAEAEPAWSPDGRTIAYTRRIPGTPVWELWLMNADGSEQRRLTKQNARVFTPAWSPDGSRIVFSSNAEGEIYELFTIGLDGKGLKSVTPTADDMFEPSWSPDGSKIAYQEGGAIFTVELGDGSVERLTDAKNNDSFPAWNPVLPPSEGD
jgi:Tol biopolymer transport system component